MPTQCLHLFCRYFTNSEICIITYVLSKSGEFLQLINPYKLYSCSVILKLNFTVWKTLQYWMFYAYRSWKRGEVVGLQILITARVHHSSRLQHNHWWSTITHTTLQSQNSHSNRSNNKFTGRYGATVLTWRGSLAICAARRRKVASVLSGHNSAGVAYPLHLACQPYHPGR